MKVFANEARRARSAMSAAALIALAACGGSDSAPDARNAPAPIRTLAYVVSECRDGASGFFERSALVVRNGERDPVTVAEIPELGPVQRFGGQCGLRGIRRLGDFSVVTGGFTRLGVSPDGSTIVFEKTDQLSAAFHDFPTPEQRESSPTRPPTGLVWVHSRDTRDDRQTE